MEKEVVARIKELILKLDSGWDIQSAKQGLNKRLKAKKGIKDLLDFEMRIKQRIASEASAKVRTAAKNKRMRKARKDFNATQLSETDIYFIGKHLGDANFKARLAEKRASVSQVENPIAEIEEINKQIKELKARAKAQLNKFKIAVGGQNTRMRRGENCETYLARVLIWEMVQEKGGSRHPQ